MNAPVTGGAGYIGSHAALRLPADGQAVTVIDDLSRGSHGAIEALRVAGRDREGRLGPDHDPETHLVPICLDAAPALRGAVTINGTDHDAPDGTCVRDLAHVGYEAGDRWTRFPPDIPAP